MRIVFVHDTKTAPFSIALVKGYKEIETRNRNTLKQLAGEKVMIARTRNSKPTDIVGTITFKQGKKVFYDEFRKLSRKHLVPADSEFDCPKHGYKWCYEIIQFECFDKPIPMPKNITRHGRVWAEICV